MLKNTNVITFVNRVAVEPGLRAELEADFEGTLKTHGLELSVSEIASLKASYRYLRGIEPVALERRIAAGKASSC